jgi:hypothetical protein
VLGENPSFHLRSRIVSESKAPDKTYSQCTSIADNNPLSRSPGNATDAMSRFCGCCARIPKRESAKQLKRRGFQCASPVQDAHGVGKGCGRFVHRNAGRSPGTHERTPYRPLWVRQRDRALIPNYPPTVRTGQIASRFTWLVMDPGSRVVKSEFESRSAPMIMPTA